MPEPENLKNNQFFTPKNSREWFLAYLFSDPDFMIEREKIIEDMKARFGEERYGVFSLVAGTLSMTEQLRKSGAQSIAESIEALAKKFNARVETVEVGLRFTSLDPKYSLRRLPSVELDGDTVIIRVGATTRLQDIKAVYSDVQELQERLPDHMRRNRSTIHPELVYAIYKQRLAKKSFKEIYDLYEKRQLPNYNGLPTLTGEEELAKMYRNHKPTI